MSQADAFEVIPSEFVVFKAGGDIDPAIANGDGFEGPNPDIDYGYPWRDHEDQEAREDHFCAQLPAFGLGELGHEKEANAANEA